MSDSSDVPPPTIPWHLLDRYLAGECSPAELAEVERWIAADESHRQVVSGLRSHSGRKDWNTESAWTRLSHQLAATPFSPAAASRFALHGPLRWMRAAAAVVLLTGTAALATYLLADHAGSAGTASVMHEATTARGERREVVLPDGSRATLAAQSRLRYPERMDGAARDVELIGEGYFSIAHDAARPFSVRAPGVVVRVTGTEFNVRAYSDTAETQIVVASGRVIVKPSHDSLAAGAHLTAGYLGRARTGGDSITVERGVAVDQLLAWKTGRLHFSARPLAEILADLERWFDAELVVRDPALGARTLTTDVRVGAGASADEALNAISLALDARVERRGRTIVLSPIPPTR